MVKFHASLWGSAPHRNTSAGHIPHTYVEADTEMQAAALAASDFRVMGKIFDGSANIDVIVSHGDEDTNKQADRRVVDLPMAYSLTRSIRHGSRWESCDRSF